MYFFRIMMNAKKIRAKLSCFEEPEQSLRKNQCYDCYQYVWKTSKIIIPDINIKKLQLFAFIFPFSNNGRVYQDGTQLTLSLAAPHM